MDCKIRTLADFWYYHASLNSGIARRNDFLPENLRPWIGRLTLLEILEEGADFLVLIQGLHINYHMEMDGTRKRFSDYIPEDRFPDLVRSFQKAISEKCPFFEKYILDNDYQMTTLERLVMPLADEDGVIRWVMSYIDFQTHCESTPITLSTYSDVVTGDCHPVEDVTCFGATANGEGQFYQVGIS